MPLSTNPLGTPYKLTLVWTDLANGRVNTEAMTYDLTKMFVGSLPITITYKSPSTWLSVSDDGNNMLTVALKDNVNIPYTDNKITVTAKDGSLKADGTENTASETITVRRNRKPRKGTAADSNVGESANDPDYICQSLSDDPAISRYQRVLLQLLVSW